MDRIYGTLELRATNDELREFEGIANTATEDDHGTIVEPSGARFKLPIPLLWGHNPKEPVGEITEARLVDGKWLVKGTIRKVKEEGFVKELTDRAWHNVKYKLVRGLSIGFIPLKEKGKRFLEWIWRELSLVTIPSNEDASILSVRSAFAASGDSPGVSGNPAANPNPNNPRRKMTYAERIQSLENSRAAKVARLDELTQKASDEGRTKDETEQEEFDTLRQEVKSVDTELVDVRAIAELNAAKATPIVLEKDKSRPGTPVVKVRSNEEPGIGFARYALALAAAKGNAWEASRIAEQRWPDQHQEIVTLLTRAAVAAGTTLDATWALPLSQPLNMVNEFLEMLRPATLLGKIPGLRRVPFNIAMPAQTGGGTYQWTGQGVAKPVSALAFSTVTLGFAKATGIIVISKELAKFSNPSAERIVRDDMIAGIAAFLDVQFTDPAIAAVANVNPASITNGIAGTAAGGTTEVFIRSDLRALLGGFVSGNFGLNGVVLLMPEAVAFTIGTVVNAVGAPAFPGISGTGGTLLGIPVVTSNAITAATGIIAVHAPSVLLADDGGVEIDASEQASLQMDSVPTNPTDATTVLVSLWQRNLIGLRADRFINWKLARATAVRRTHTIAYV